MQADLTTLYSTLATAAATLIGLLFVAISIVPERLRSEGMQVSTEIQASGCMLCFIDVLLVALFGLAKANNVGETAFIIGLVGIVYALASLRSLLAMWRSLRHINYSQLGFIAVFMTLFIIQTFTGLSIANNHAKSLDALGQFSNLPIIILLTGVGRAWQLIGSRDTGVISSLTTLIRGDKTTARSKTK